MASKEPETMTVELPLLTGKEEDVTVGLNGKFIQIRRGEPVDIPMWAYEILQQSKNREKELIAQKRQLTAAAEEKFRELDRR